MIRMLLSIFVFVFLLKISLTNTIKYNFERDFATLAYFFCYYMFIEGFLFFRRENG